MYTANHLEVEAIVALTESGSTPLWMSRIRSDIPIFAFTRHERTRRRVALYRGVYPVPFDITHTDPAELYAAISRELVERKFVAPGRRDHPDARRALGRVWRHEYDEAARSNGLSMCLCMRPC